MLKRVMPSVRTVWVVFAALAQVAIVLGQTCDNTQVSQVLHSDITSDNGVFRSSISLQGQAAVDSNGVTLTSTSAAAYGGFFLTTNTNFQGDGGFSSKFAIQAVSGQGLGEAWEFIIASEANRAFAPPPYAEGSASYGLSGWSRSNSFVVEFDAVANSGAAEQDFLVSGPHIAVYLDGIEQCKTPVDAAFASGSVYYIWIDYIGFSSTLQIRVSAAGQDARPSSVTTSCSVDIWSVMDIDASNYVGIAAYNPSSSSGASHALRSIFTLVDAYRPVDTDGQCAFYSRCSLKTENSLCTSPRGDGTTCLLTACLRTPVWDVAGSLCCAFVEKSSWRIAGGVVAPEAGRVVSCSQQRTTIVYEAPAGTC